MKFPDLEKKVIHDACLHYRHDFDLLDEQTRNKIIFECMQWHRALQKAFMYRGEQSDG